MPLANLHSPSHTPQAHKFSPSLMTRYVWLTVALAATSISTTTIQAATCTQAQMTAIDGLYNSAAKRVDCAPYAKVLAPSGTMTIQYTCTTTASCLPIMEQLARQLPDCELPTNGANRKEQLEYGLYKQCKLCSDTQDAQITALWQAAAKTSACAQYARPSTSSAVFSWPCSASSCSSVLEGMATQVPDCFTGSVNEKSRIVNAVSTCKSASPGSSNSSTGSTNSGKACSESDRKESESLWDHAVVTPECGKYLTITSGKTFIRWPCSSTSCTTVMETLADKLPSCVLPGFTTSEKTTLLASITTCRATQPTSDDPQEEEEENGSASASAGSTLSESTRTPTPTQVFSASLCTAPQVTSLASQFIATATGEDCRKYSNTTAFRITIHAPCSSSCVTKSFQAFASSVPDCFYWVDTENKKREVTEALATCADSSSSNASRARGLRLSASSASSSSSNNTGSSKYVTLSFVSQSRIEASGSVTPAPVMTSASHVVGGASPWLVAALVACVICATL